MIVIMEPGASKEYVNSVVARVQEMGLGAHLSEGEERTIRVLHACLLLRGPASAVVVCLVKGQGQCQARP